MLLHLFDLPILDWIAEHLSSGFLDKVMPVITLLGDGGMLLSLILAVFGTVFAVPSFFFALYQLLWIAALTLFGKCYI